MKKHNTSSPPRFVALMKLLAIRLGYQKTIAKSLVMLAGAALLGFISQSALAVPNNYTLAGTNIINTATLTYTAPGIPAGTASSNTVTFMVDNKVNVTVAKVADAPGVVPGATNQVLRFTVTNDGNDLQRYALTAVAGTPATIVGIVPPTIYLDVNNNGAVDGGDTLYVSAATFGNVAKDASLNILVVANIPSGAVNTNAALYDLVATTVDANTTTVTLASAGPDNILTKDVVFADALGSADGLRDGKHSASATYTVTAPVLTVIKSVSLLCDRVTGSAAATRMNIPDAVVQYAITIQNAVGAATATLTNVTDTLNANLAFDTRLIDGIGTVAPTTTCASATGNSLSASGFSAIRGTGATSYVVPGAALQNTTAGATITGQNLTIDFVTLAGTAYGAANAALLANGYITVYYNAVVK